MFSNGLGHTLSAIALFGAMALLGASQTANHRVPVPQTPDAAVGCYEASAANLRGLPAGTFPSCELPLDTFSSLQGPL